MLTQAFSIKDWAFLEFRGKPVPFYTEHTKAEFADEIVLKLRGIDSIEQATALLGRPLLLPTKLVKKAKNTNDWNLEGYTFIDEHLGVIGVVHGIVDNTYQSLALLHFQDREVMIPLVDEIILGINDKKKEVLVALPEGILNLN